MKKLPFGSDCLQIKISLRKFVYQVNVSFWSSDFALSRIVKEFLLHRVSTCFSSKRVSQICKIRFQTRDINMVASGVVTSVLHFHVKRNKKKTPGKLLTFNAVKYQRKKVYCWHILEPYVQNSRKSVIFLLSVEINIISTKILQGFKEVFLRPITL